MPVTLSSPLSLYSIPVVWVTAFYPMTMKFLLIDKMMGYNNIQPRSNTDKFVRNKNIHPDIAARAERMEGAHLNGNEAFPLWTAAILAGNFAGIDNRTLNISALGYIAARLLYNHVYINHESGGMSWLRSTIFFSGVAFPITLLIKAANKISAA
ncbi:hypothetical protein BD779DRAFT_1611294 [Infundibulicybe gibba]|nr:hypothetical protein BD779DRAFT_1611294 [Infundibulicybe gibba]